MRITCRNYASFPAFCYVSKHFFIQKLEYFLTFSAAFWWFLISWAAFVICYEFVISRFFYFSVSQEVIVQNIIYLWNKSQRVLCYLWLFIG